MNEAHRIYDIFLQDEMHYAQNKQFLQNFVNNLDDELGNIPD